MWIAAGLLVFVYNTVSAKLTGDHICPEENRYTINVTEYFIRNSTIRRYEWCLSVPPRCSKYSTRLVNDSKVVEKEVADLIDKCCSGYKEDKESGTCVPICPDCINGKCIQGKCDCLPGYKGSFCDADCGPDEWGENCKFRCTCEHGSCDSKTGSCVCPSGWTGNRCEIPCSNGFYGRDCTEKCTCKLDELCDYITGECEESVTTTLSSTSYKTTFSTPYFYKKSTKTYILTKTKLSKNLVQFKNNGKFNTDKDELISTVPTTPLSDTTDVTVPVVTKDLDMEMSANYQDQSDNDNERQFINILTTVKPQIVKPAKVKVKEVSESSHPHEENYLNDEAHRGNINQPPLNQNDLVNSASAATAISVAIIIVAVLIVVTNHFIRSKKRVGGDGDRTKGISTVSVYTHSIFHTPLPEPPTFENPIFITPIDTNSNEGQRIETRVVCSMNFPSHPVKDPREYLYDHPPSTGSYRAASIPEPPDINNMSPVLSLTQGEPLYDEIPSGMAPTPVSQPPPSYKSSSLYMNTCGKTRL